MRILRRGNTLRTVLVIVGLSVTFWACPANASGTSVKPIRDKTFVVWCSPAGRDQKGSGALTLEQPAGFDSVVLGEVKTGAWMAGSDNFARTNPQQAASRVETIPFGEIVQIAIVYRQNTVSLYRNGALYDQYTITQPMEFRGPFQIEIGLRHKALMSGFFAGFVEEARLYRVALDAAQIKSLKLNVPGQPAPLGMWTFQNGTKDVLGTFLPGELHGGATVKDGKLFLDGKQAYMVTPPMNTQETALNTGSSTLHFRPRTGSAGDTIPFFWKGEYHLFYLWEGSWAHIVTKDLVHWKELPIALTKGTDPLGPDGEACWTGSIVEHQGMFHLFYTGKNSQDPKGDQKVMHATSHDLIHWTVHREQTFYADGKIYWSKPVDGAIDDKLIYHHQAFRDPSVFWNAKRQEWWMLLHTCLADGSSPAMGLYASTDLIHWDVRPPLVVYSAGISGDCPDIFTSHGKWYIQCADNRYFSAPEAEGPYELSPLPYDVGDLRVPKVMFDGKRNVLIGWMGDRQDNSDTKPMIWGGTLSMAREFYANPSGQLCQRPAAESVRAFHTVMVEEPQGKMASSHWNVPFNFLLSAKLQATTPDTKLVVAFRQPDDGSAGGYHLAIDFQTKEVDLGDAYRSNKRVCNIDVGAPIQIRLFVVNDVIECFINNAYSFTMRAYDWKGSGLSLSASSGGFENRGLSVLSLAGK